MQAYKAEQRIFKYSKKILKKKLIYCPKLKVLTIR